MEKNILDYTTEELEELSIESLELLYQEARNKEEFFNVSQMMQKNLMNSVN